MAITYNTTSKQITVTATSTVRNLYDDSMTTFAGSSYMQFLLPLTGVVKDALYSLSNGWVFDNTTSIDYLTSSALKDAADDNEWDNVQTISPGSLASGSYIYINQGGTVTVATHTGHINQLLKVRASGANINSKNFTVYLREFQTAYSQFSVTGGAVVSTVPLTTNTADPNLTIDSTTLTGYSDLTITWGTFVRSAFDGVSTTKYTLNGNHTDSVTTITVNESIDGSVASSGNLQIDDEVIHYTGKGTSTFTGCTRAYSTTTAVSHSDQANLSTNTQPYGILIKTSDSSRTLKQIYNWVQYKLSRTTTTDIDSATGGHLGYITDPLLAMSGPVVTTLLNGSAGVWVEGFSAADANNIIYTDSNNVQHSSPLSVAVVVNIDAALSGGQVYVAVLNTPFVASTYTPTQVTQVLLNEAIASTQVSTSLTYTSDLNARVVVRKPGYQQFELGATITSAGLTVTAQNPVDGAY